MNGLVFLILITAPGLVLILNKLSIKAQSGRVSLVPASRPDWDWGDECNEVEFFFPATERPLSPDVRESTAMSGVERKPPRSVAGGTL